MNTSRQRLLPWAIVFVVGLLIGWLGLGWWLLPVHWTNTDPVDLRPTARQQYLDMVAESYALTKDALRAQSRLESWSKEEAGRLILVQADQYQREGKLMEEQRLRDLAQALGLTGPATTQPSPTAARPTPAPTSAAGARSRLAGVLGIVLAIPLLVIGGGILYYLWRQRRAAAGEASIAEEEEEFAPAAAPLVRPTSSRMARSAAPPAVGMQEFTATYNLGDSEYDQSFTIEDASGNYRGECGIGVAEKVGSTAGPATALEVWLFDKSDIRTVTKLLLTDFAYNDPGIRSRLATKGDMVLAMPGQSFMLETQSLVAAAEITELDYATVDPPRSSIARLTIKLRVHAKE